MPEALTKTGKKAGSEQKGQKQLKLLELTPEERHAAKLFYARKIERAFEKLVPQFRDQVKRDLLTKGTKEWSTDSVRVTETVGRRPSISYEKVCGDFPAAHMAPLATITKEDMVEYIKKMDQGERDSLYKKHGVTTPQDLTTKYETTKTYPVIDVDLLHPIPEEELSVVYSLHLRDLKTAYMLARRALRRQERYTQRLQRELADHVPELEQMELQLPPSRKAVA